MAQHDYVIDNQPGAAFRGDLNSVLSAIITNNSAATEPSVKYPNMWWFDTSTGLLKRRDNLNTTWITVGLEAADTDGTLSANSDLKIPTQKATKTYSDTKVIAPASTTENKVPQWDSTSKKLKDGLTLGTSANNIVQMDANAKLPPVDASQLLNVPSGKYSGVTVFSGTLPNIWTDLDLSSVVGANRALVFLEVAAYGQIAFRTNGSSGGLGLNSYDLGCSGGTPSSGSSTYMIAVTDSSGIVEWGSIGNEGGSAVVTLVGYIKLL